MRFGRQGPWPEELPHSLSVGLGLRHSIGSETLGSRSYRQAIVLRQSTAPPCKAAIDDSGLPAACRVGSFDLSRHIGIEVDQLPLDKPFALDRGGKYATVSNLGDSSHKQVAYGDLRWKWSSASFLPRCAVLPKTGAEDPGADAVRTGTGSRQRAADPWPTAAATTRSREAVRSQFLALRDGEDVPTYACDQPDEMEADLAADDVAAAQQVWPGGRPTP